jgi:hypothetical protein
MILAHWMMRYRPSSSDLSMVGMIVSRSGSNDVSILCDDTRIEP